MVDRPSVIFAYTIKAWRLPTMGHPANHSALLTGAQWETLAPELGADASDPWARFPDGTPEAELCREVAQRLKREPRTPTAPPATPPDVGRSHTGTASTQQAFGRFFVDLAHAAPEVAARVVTVSPDVASSTNLGGWLNRVGVWNVGDRIDWFADDTDTLVRWRESAHGQHIELGIAETNLVGLLAELGLTWSRDGEPLLPIGTLYDPFVSRVARAVVLRHLRGRAVDPGGHPVRRHARARGRRAPVDHHPLDRARAAALHRLGAGLRPRSGVGAARRPGAAGAQRWPLGILPALDAADRPGARGHATRGPGARTSTPSGAGGGLPVARGRTGRRR